MLQQTDPSDIFVNFYIHMYIYVYARICSDVWNYQYSDFT